MNIRHGLEGVDLSAEDRQIILFLARADFAPKRIAALFDITQNRVNEALREAQRATELSEF